MWLANGKHRVMVQDPLCEKMFCYIVWPIPNEKEAAWYKKCRVDSCRCFNFMKDLKERKYASNYCIFLKRNYKKQNNTKHKKQQKKENKGKRKKVT